ncbi:hypothetical protein [Blautia faecis]|nr:hypothetical protein [Blautia faecis]
MWTVTNIGDVAVDSVGKVGTQDSDGTSGLNDWYYSTELLIAQS